MQRASPWFRTHTPKKATEVVGQQQAVERVKRYVETFRKGQRPLLLHGPPGSGKTATIYALAEELDREVIEVNASDTRNKDAVNSLLGSALRQQSLFFKGKIVLVDEADGLSGNSDRGGVQALIALLVDARFPVIITANDAEAEKLKALKKACETIEYAPVAPKHIEELLKRIAKREKVTFDDEAVSAIARRSGGDCRAAINDLQTLSAGGTLTLDDLDALGDREQKEKLQNALLRVFKTTSAAVALPAFDNVDAEIDQLFLWIDENLPKEYKRPEDLARAYDALAEADRYFGRIRRWQHYRFYVYIYNLLSAGVALAKDEKYPGVKEYQRSSRLLSIWIMNQKNAKRKSVAEKLAARTHCSTKRATQEVMILKPLLASKDGRAVAAELELDADEIAWVRK